MSGQEHPKPAPIPQHQENTAKQSWDDEGGSLHPDETPTPTVALPEPIDTSEHAEKPPTAHAPPAKKPS